MITKINIAAASAASASTEASAASAQPITPGGIKQIFNDMEIRTADINAAVDYPQLFRGLSTFELDRMDSLNGMVNNKQGALIGKREPQQEELTDLLIQQQPIAIEVVGHGSGKTFNTLTTMKLEVFTVHHQENQINKENFTELPGLIVPGRSSTDSISTESSANHGLQSTNAAQPQKKKRGRRPTSMVDVSNKHSGTRSGSKRELSIEVTEKTTVSFGNKKVKKDTDEYKERRVKNNEAVKKCRMKNLQELSLKEERMKGLEDENKRLSGKVETLLKELSVLKNIILQMSPTRGKLPEHVEKMIKRFEET